MKKGILLPYLWTLSILLSGCSIQSQEDRETRKEINTLQKEEFLIRDEIKAFLSGDADFVTEDGGLGTFYEKFLQDGNCLLYRNEIFGFQMELPQNWDQNCKIVQETYFSRDGIITTHIRFYFFRDDNFIESRLLSSGWSNLFQVNIVDEYNNGLLQKSSGMGGTQDGARSPRRNNLYYFSTSIGNADSEYYESFFPEMKKEEFLCEGQEPSGRCRVGRTVESGFSIFDV